MQSVLLSFLAILVACTPVFAQATAPEPPTVTVSGDGYNGPGTFTFDLRDGLIARFLIA